MKTLYLFFYHEKNVIIKKTMNSHSEYQRRLLSNEMEGDSFSLGSGIVLRQTAARLNSFFGEKQETKRQSSDYFVYSAAKFSIGRS